MQAGAGCGAAGRVSAAEEHMGVPGHMHCLCMNGRVLTFICNSERLEFMDLC